MNLHDAIIQVLKKAGTPLSCRDIADIINKDQLYKKRDLSPIKGGQISARINIHICLKLIEPVNQYLFLYLDC